MGQPLLAGRTAVVTGAAQGIGYAIAELFVAEGARVVIGDLNAQTVELAAKQLGGTEVARGVRCDVTQSADVDTLLAILPGGATTRKLVDASVLAALGPRGVFVNVARGSVVDEPALVEALRSKTILAAGLDVFADEPRVPQALLEMDNVVLLPHVGSATHFTRGLMGKLVVDNIVSWFAGKGPVTPVPETPWPR